MLLDDQIAIVTAAGRGIGRAIALELAREGARVAVNSYGEETTRSTVAAIEAAGGTAFGHAGDITDPGIIAAMVAATRERFGRVDILVNNVGAGPKSAIQPQEGPLGGVAALWDALYAQNLKPVMLMCEAVMPHMRGERYGKIVNISSIAGRTSLSPRMLEFFVHPAYSAMKAALVSYTQTLAELLGPDNINVNAVCPGIVYTDVWAASARRAVRTMPEFEGMGPRTWFEGIARGDYPHIFDRTPMRREQTVEDIAHAVAFLASQRAANITGQSLMVDGGMVKP